MKILKRPKFKFSPTQTTILFFLITKAQLWIQKILKWEKINFEVRIFWRKHFVWFVGWGRVERVRGREKRLHGTENRQFNGERKRRPRLRRRPRDRRKQFRWRVGRGRVQTQRSLEENWVCSSQGGTSSCASTASSASTNWWIQTAAFKEPSSNAN